MTSPLPNSKKTLLCYVIQRGKSNKEKSVTHSSSSINKILQSFYFTEKKKLLEYQKYGY